MLILFLTCTLSAQVPKWTVELDEPIKEYNFINGGKYLFFTNGPYLWCYDAAAGNKIWETEVNGFEETGMHSLLGDIYLVGTEDNLKCYDAVSGKLKWEQSYNDIDQSDYTSFEFVKNTAVIRYGEFEVAVDLDSGKELWRMGIDYWGELVQKGSFNYMVLEEQNKMMVLEDSEILSLFDIQTGKKLYTAEGFDINTDLIASGNSWLYSTPDQSHLLFILDKGAVLIDAVNNKQIAKKDFDVDGDMNVLLPTLNGCAVMGEEKFVHFNFKTGKVDELDFPVDDIRTMHVIDVNNKALLMVSLDSRMAVVDLENAKVLWQTKEDDPEFDGYAHRYLKQMGEDIVLTYNRIKTFGDDRGTHLYVEKINALTGKVSYKTEVLQSQVVMAGFVRTLTNIVGGLVTGIGDAMAHGTAAQQHQRLSEYRIRI
jgi:outer membrane protein assembly factor BamB